MSDAFPIPIICGPTASGKTGLAVRLAERFPVEVVSADSRQVFRRLNIGTAKPTAEECNKVRFHLVDMMEPGERYTAFRFMEDANRAIGEILARGAVPLVVGGTGLYLRALTDGVVEIAKDDMAIRERLESEMDELGPEAMHRRLATIDPVEAATVHPNNRVRVIRALELFELTGKCKSELVETGAYKKAEHVFEYHCLVPDRELLYERINHRVDQMMDDGLLAEVENLVAEGRAEALRRVPVIGYSELLDYLDGDRGLDEAVSLIKQNSRRYAKRQFTWFRHQADCIFYSDPEAAPGALTGIVGERLRKNL